MSDRAICAIPARWSSTRFPGKPLSLIAGRPMIEWVWQRACRAPEVDRVVVLTDDERIRQTVHGFGGECELTPSECQSGTDRIAWAAREWACEVVINVQGDEPLIEPSEIGRLAHHLLDHPGDEIATLATPVAPLELDDPHRVKVVLDTAGRALYFSRAGIPYPRNDDGAPVLRHVGLYGYQRAALLRMASLDQTPLELREGLEQLRALENGMTIRVLESREAPIGVDTPEDLERIEALVNEHGLGEDRTTGTVTQQEGGR